MTVIKRLQQSRQMRTRRQHNQHMKNLMRMPPNIKLPRPQPLRHPHRIDHRTQNIQTPLQQQPPQPNLPAHPREPKHRQAMHDRKHRRQPHRDKHGRAERPPRRRSEARHRRNGGAAHAQQADHRPVEPLQARHAVESVVDAGDEAAGDEAHDADIVACVADVGHERGVVGDGVVEGAHGEAKGGAGEEAAKDCDVSVVCGFVARGDGGVEDEGDGEGEEGGKEVGVDVDGLVVDVEMAHRSAHSRTGSGWGRQKQPTDPLEQAGFVSKGDISLLDVRAQESYYRTIMDRYAQFCKDNSGNLDAAFASLPRNPSDDATKNPPVNFPQKPDPKKQSTQPIPQAAKELSILLVSLRKLREAILATAAKTPVPFSQDVHIFCVRTALLAAHPPSYYPPLERLLKHLHTRANPLGTSALSEFITYLILDYACRQGNLTAAFQLREKAKAKIAYQHDLVDHVLSALTHDNWVLFWRAREHGDGYVRSLMDWAADSMRLRALKSIGKSYLTVELGYLIESCTGRKNGCTWEELVQKQGLGWKKEEDKVIIRVRKSATGNTKPIAT
ncbi:hypothetical protein PRK78_000519 [Emydomyces testavorans]|uniref:CSN8/PSMD8/EIF3K domain-containing protein n=1 Tax=Emydomyces testavorans TaxID=2070801 RepID=A0AAF0IFY2_9EURO|nr:hypothetical protein PRK78_000519 [Emydomyces testavorans]